MFSLQFSLFFYLHFLTRLFLSELFPGSFDPSQEILFSWLDGDMEVTTNQRTLFLSP